MAASSSIWRCSSNRTRAVAAAGVLLLVGAGGAAAKPQRIVSLNVCAGQVLIDLVPPARIRSVTFLAADPVYSNVAARAAKLPLNRGLAEDKARLMAHAAFGLMNSTPYSATPAGGRPSAAESRAVLRAMTVAALHANKRA